MIADEQRTLQLLEPLIKIVKDRQLLYFQALAFVNKNIESSSNDSEQIYLFNKFLHASQETEVEIAMRQTILLKQVGPNLDFSTQGFKVVNTSKYIDIQIRQMRRISARALEMLQTSIHKSRNTLFGENGKLGVDFSRFKKNLHEISREQHIDLTDFTTVIIHFVKNKFKRQILKIKEYINRLQAGEHISLRQLFVKEDSNTQASPDEKSIKFIRPFRHTKKVSKESSPEGGDSSPLNKKSLTKKSFQNCNKTKRTLNLKSIRNQDGDIDQYQQKKTQKSATAVMLLKFYIMMDLNKKQFLEDYVFEKIQKEKQRKRLMTTLMERNIKNAEQIVLFKTKYENYTLLHQIHNHNSSDENTASVTKNNSSVNSRASLKTSFVILRRKGSFLLESGSDKDKSDAEQNSANRLPTSKTIKNFSPAYKRTSKLKQSDPNKKILAVKAPLIFNDEIIPNAQITNFNYIKPSFTQRDKARRNQHIRLKKKNNPIPFDQKYLPQAFHISKQPF